VRRAWLLLVFAPAACLFPDLGDLQGDAATSDVSTSDVIDAQPPTDSGAEAGQDVVVVDAGPEAGYCASLGGTHALCEDFDTTTIYNQQFTNVHLSANGTLGNDTTIVATPPRSLLATIPAEGSKLGDDAFMTRVFTGTATKATYSFDFRVDSLPSGGKSGVFAAIVFDDNQPDAHSLAIYTTDTYAALEESYAGDGGSTLFKDHQLSNPVPIGQWTRISLSIDVTAHTCAASIDGVAVVVNAPIDPSWKPNTPAIDLGLTYISSETTAWQVRYDDVVFDFQ
jgi:hypothetical protein